MPRQQRSAALQASRVRLGAVEIEGAQALALEELEELTLLDGQPSTPALRVVPPAKPPRKPATEALYARARLLWPGLDARALSRCGGDPRRVARLVARRTVLTEESIVALLLKR